MHILYFSPHEICLLPEYEHVPKAWNKINGLYLSCSVGIPWHSTDFLGSVNAFVGEALT